MSQIQINVDESISELLGDSPEEIERSALEIIVLDLYRRHAISVGRASEILGLDLLSFIRWSGARGVPYFDLSDEDLEQERRAIESM
jgi:predicted HTH domain antitoxin